MLSTGTILQNRYRIVSLLGQGGMGAVYRAWDLRLNTAVAVKEMTPDPNADTQALGGARAQFQHEAQILASLSHPNLPRVIDCFSLAGNEYLVMDFVEGENLQDVQDRSGGQPLDEAQVLDWARQLLDAMEYCHARGVIHRDIKPSNVRLTPEGRAVLVDFGLVKLYDPTNPKTATIIRGLGTPEYTPLEQYDVGKGHTDARADLYSLGATLFHLLTGQAPPTATQRVVNPGSLVAPRSLNSKLSQSTEAAVLRAMRIRPHQRFQNAAEMRQALFPATKSTTTISPPTLSQLTFATLLSQASALMAQKVIPILQQLPVLLHKVPPAMRRLPPLMRKLPTQAWGGIGLIGLILILIIFAGSSGGAGGKGTPTPTLASRAAATVARPGSTAVPMSTPTKRPTSTRILTPTKRPTSTRTPTPTRKSSSTRTATKTPTLRKPTPTPPVIAEVTADELNVRSGPGTHYSKVGKVYEGDQLKVQGRNSKGDWLKVITPGGQGGWVAAEYIEVSVPIGWVAVAATPSPGPMVDPHFRADRTSLPAGECTYLRWDVDGVSGVYLDGGGVVGHYAKLVCPKETHTYVLTVHQRDERWVPHELTIHVSGRVTGRMFVIEYHGCRGHGSRLGSVKGQVFDKQGRVIQGAAVKIGLNGGGWDDPANPAVTNQDGWYEWWLNVGLRVQFLSLDVQGQPVSFGPQGFEVLARSGCFQHVDFREQ